MGPPWPSLAQGPGVGGGQPDAARFGGGHGVAERATEVKGVPHGDRAEAEGPGLVDGQAHRLVTGQLAERVPGVQRGDGAEVHHGLRGFVGADRSVQDPLDVHRYEQGAVRADPAAVGVHKGLRDRVRRRLGEADRGEDPFDQVGHPVDRNGAGFAHREPRALLVGVS